MKHSKQFKGKMPADNKRSPQGEGKVGSKRTPPAPNQYRSPK